MKKIMAMAALFAAFFALAGSIPTGELLTTPQDPTQGELRYWVVDLNTREFVGFGAWDGTDCAVRKSAEADEDGKAAPERIEIRAVLRTRDSKQAPAYTIGEIRRVLAVALEAMESEGPANWKEQLDGVFSLNWAETRRGVVYLNETKPSTLLYPEKRPLPPLQLASGNAARDGTGGCSRW